MTSANGRVAAARILAFADTQLGVATLTLDDQRDVLDQIVQTALEREVDLVIHGGDVFEGPVVMPEQLRCFVDAMRPLREHGIPLVVLRGNGRHDMAVRAVHALDILREIDGIIVNDRPANLPFVFVKSDAGVPRGVVVTTLPWVHPGSLIAQENGSVDHDRLNEAVSRLLVKIARQLYESAEVYYESGHRYAQVLVAHWAISGAKLPTGFNVEQMREPVLPWADLSEIGYDALIAGHIHEPQEISDPRIDKTLGIVVGSPQQLNFGEHGAHGCWIIDVDTTLAEPDGAGSIPIAGQRSEKPGGSPGRDMPPASELSGSASAEFIPIPSIRFDTFNVEDEAGLDGLREGFCGIDATDSIMRVRYSASEDQARTIDHAVIRRAFMEAGARRVQIEPNIIRQERARAPEITEQRDKADALAAWCEANGVGAELQRRMIDRLQDWQAQ